jgi:hypothetical protein
MSFSQEGKYRGKADSLDNLRTKNVLLFSKVGKDRGKANSI